MKQQGQPQAGKDESGQRNDNHVSTEPVPSGEGWRKAGWATRFAQSLRRIRQWARRSRVWPWRVATDQAAATRNETKQEPMEQPLERVERARARMREARTEADVAAAHYRAAIAQVVQEWQHDGISIRKAAVRLEVSEGALRDLLRPPGQARRSK